MAVYKGAILVLILSCVGVAAPSVRAVGAPAIGQISKPDFRPSHGVVQGSALTAADAQFDISPDGSKADIAPPAPRITLNSGNMIVGIASFYEGAQETSSGEQYDPAAFTAAAQLEIRDMFGGIRFGKNYQPAYAIGEFGGKKIIVKFNDVGPLMPGRKFDLSRAAMAYFDESLQTGLLPEFKMTPLPLGQAYPTGPVSDEQLVAMGIAYGDDAIVTASATPAVEPQPEISTEEKAATRIETHGDEEEGALISTLVRDDEGTQETGVVEPSADEPSTADVATNLSAPPMLVFADKVVSDRITGMLRGWSRFLSVMNETAGPAGESPEQGQIRGRKDGRVENGDGFLEAGYRHFLLI